MKISRFYFLLLFLTFSVFSQNQSERYHRAKITYGNKENLVKLIKAGVAIDHGFHKTGLAITSDFSDSEIQAAKALGLQVELIIEDIQKFYREQNKTRKENRQAPSNSNCQSTADEFQTPFNFTQGSMGGYFTYDEMLAQLDAMHSAFPDLISSRESIEGFPTSEGRLLQWVKIAANQNAPSSRPQVLYTAVHHAREPISLSQTIFYMWYLLENYESNDEIRRIVDQTELYFIPVINPDGYIYNQITSPDGGGMWRKNRRPFDNGLFGVDNNRNYDFWKDGDAAQSVWNTTGVAADATGDTYPGQAPMSEPENRAIAHFLDTHNIKIALNAHTFSNLLLHPYGYDLSTFSPDEITFDKLGELMVSKNGYDNILSSILYPASGNSDDFMYGQTMNHAKILSYTPEIGSSFWPAQTDIVPLCKEMMFTNLMAARFVLDYTILKDTSPEYLGSNEVVEAKFDLTKAGQSSNGTYTVSVNPVSSNITAVGLPFTATNMNLFDKVSSSISLQLASGTTTGDPIIYELIVDHGSYQDRLLVSKKFGGMQTVFINTCNSLSGFTGTGWATTTEDFVSPATSITDSPNANYGDSQQRVITLSSAVTVPNTPGVNLTFEAKWAIEKNFDAVRFQIRPGNSTTWISQCGKYTRSGNTQNGQPDGPLYDGIQESWVTEQISLEDYAGQSIRMRFILNTDQGTNLDGFYFDDIKISVPQSTTLATVTQNLDTFRIYPNPVGDELQVNTTLSNYNVHIYNTLGQLVYSRDVLNGFQRLDVGILQTGTYFVEIQANGFSEKKKMYKL